MCILSLITFCCIIYGKGLCCICLSLPTQTYKLYATTPLLFNPKMFPKQIVVGDNSSAQQRAFIIKPPSRLEYAPPDIFTVGTYNSLLCAYCLLSFCPFCRRRRLKFSFFSFTAAFNGGENGLWNYFYVSFCDVSFKIKLKCCLYTFFEGRFFFVHRYRVP